MCAGCSTKSSRVVVSAGLSPGLARRSGGRRYLRRCLARVARQRHTYDGADAELGAQTHRSSMEVGQRTRNGKSKPGAMIGLRKLAFDLLERSAEPRQRLRRDADAAVGDHQHDGIAEHPAADYDLAAFRREFNG